MNIENSQIITKIFWNNMRCDITVPTNTSSAKVKGQTVNN